MAVCPDTEHGCVEGCHSLCEKGCNATREDVAAATGCHAGVARFVDVNPFAIGDDRSVAFESEHDFLTSRKPRRNPFAVFLNFRNTTLFHARKLTRMRCENGRHGPIRKHLDLEDVQCVRVENDWRSWKSGQHGAKQFGDIGSITEARANGHDIGVVGEMDHGIGTTRVVECLCRLRNRSGRVARVSHRHDLLNIGRASHRDQARSASQCRTPAENGRSAHSLRTGHDQHAAERAFVRIGRTGWKCWNRGDVGHGELSKREITGEFYGRLNGATPVRKIELILNTKGSCVMSSQPPLDGELGYASLDLERAVRCGFPEVVFAEGKTNEWLAGALHRLIDVGQDTFATRVSAEQANHLAIRFPTAEQDRLARTFWFPQSTPKPGVGDILVVTAGTGDLPVAQEALVTARVMGANAEMIVDVGVAGLHRILSKRDRLAKADVIIVVAGMDGALPSVVGGLVSCPVIACPTSIGYGASFGGIAALLTMLNSCSAGVAVVNIDGGFKAGSIAARMVKRMMEKPRK